MQCSAQRSLTVGYFWLETIYFERKLRASSSYLLERGGYYVGEVATLINEVAIPTSTNQRGKNTVYVYIAQYACM